MTTAQETISSIRQEIERRIKLCNAVPICSVRAEVNKQLLSFLDTLSEEPDKSLEEAAEEYEKEHTYQRYDGGGLTPEYDTTLAEAFIAGAEWQKEQMLKDAVEGEVIKTDKHTSVRYKSFYGTDRYFYGIADKQFKPGDKVRILVLKAEEE